MCCVCVGVVERKDITEQNVGNGRIKSNLLQRLVAGGTGEEAISELSLPSWGSTLVNKLAVP